MTDPDTFSAHEIFRERVRLLPGREWASVLDVVEEVSGHLREMGFVPNPQGVGYGHPPLSAERGKTNPGIGFLQCRNPALERRSESANGTT